MAGTTKASKRKSFSEADGLVLHSSSAYVMVKCPLDIKQKTSNQQRKEPSFDISEGIPRSCESVTHF